MGYQIWVGADNERTPPLCVVHLRLEGVYGGDHRSHQLQQSESFRGQLNRTLDTVKEGATELRFQFPKVRRYRLLTKLQCSGCLGNAADPGNMVKTDEFRKFRRPPYEHNRSPLELIIKFP